MLADLARVAAYSASASFGRDMYKSFKKGNILVFLLAGMFLTVMGFRHMVKGHDRGVLSTIFITVIGSVLMILLGLIFAAPAIFYLGSAVAPATEGAPEAQANAVRTQSAIIVGLIYILCSAVVGLIWGLRNRAVRNRAIEVEEHNLKFLDQEGFRDLGVGEDIIEDPDGNRLKFKSEEDNLLVFMVVGRRNVRAAINLDDDGRMLSVYRSGETRMKLRGGR